MMFFAKLVGSRNTSLESFVGPCFIVFDSRGREFRIAVDLCFFEQRSNERTGVDRMIHHMR
jgi:hypothetical protein